MLRSILVVACCLYVYLCVLFNNSVSPHIYVTCPKFFLLCGWYLSGTILIASNALELSLVVMRSMMALVERLLGKRLRTEDVAAVELTKRRETLGKFSVAIIVPAHEEAATSADREMLVARIFNWLRNTPHRCPLYLLFDSKDPEQQANDEEVVRRAVELATCTMSMGDPQIDPARIRYRCYPSKSQERDNKSGSLLNWIDELGYCYDYMFLMDADSSLPEEAINVVSGTDTISRMADAMDRDPAIALIQATVLIDNVTNLWSWYQSVNSRMAHNYLTIVYETLLQNQCPCYGHNVLIRIKDFEDICKKDTVRYSSHDHVDAANLAIAGRKCLLSRSAITYEGAEHTFNNYFARDFRWAKGNIQWSAFVCRNWFRLPLACKTYLLLGVMQYVWPLMTVIFVVCSAALIATDRGEFAGGGAATQNLLLYLVVLSLMGPRIAASESPTELIGSLLIGATIGPAITVHQALFCLCAPAAIIWCDAWPKWRKSRTPNSRWQVFVREALIFAVPLLLGGYLWSWLPSRMQWSMGEMLLRLMLICWMFSPLAAVVLTLPLHALEARVGSNADLPTKASQLESTFSRLE